MRAASPDVALTLLDNDAVALAAAGENVPGARLVLGDRLGDAGTAAYDAILSNPPLHRGIAEDHAQLEQLVTRAPEHLGAGGLLQVVVQRRVPLDRLLPARFEQVRIVAENGRYRVWRARTSLSPSFYGERAGVRGRSLLRRRLWPPLTLPSPRAGRGAGRGNSQPRTSCAARSSAAPPATPTARLRLKPK